MKIFPNMKQNKQKALLLLTRQIIDPDAESLTYEEIANECKISLRQLFRWRTQDKEFTQAREELVETYADEILTDAYAALRFQLKKNKNVKAAETLLKSRGKLIERREVTADVNQTVHDVSEQDNDELKRELEELQTKLGVNKADEEE